MRIKVTNRKYLKQKISDVLLEYKNANHITYQELAELLGTNYLQVNRWVKKQSLPVPDTLKNICSTLGIDYHSFLSGSDEFADRITIKSLSDHYELQAQDSDKQKKLIIIASALVYDYLRSRGLHPTVLVRETSDHDTFSDPSNYDTQALFTMSSMDNILLFGNPSFIKFRFLGEDSEAALVLTDETFVNAVNRQLIKQNLI